MSCSDGRQHCRITWRGIGIEVSFSPSDIMAHAHLELHTDNRAQLPVTETGYRSHFLPRGVVEAAGGPEAFVLAWLEKESKSPEWRKREAAARQLDLFS